MDIKELGQRLFGAVSTGQNKTQESNSPTKTQHEPVVEPPTSNATATPFAGVAAPAPVVAKPFRMPFHQRPRKPHPELRVVGKWIYWDFGNLCVVINPVEKRVNRIGRDINLNVAGMEMQMDEEEFDPDSSETEALMLRDLSFWTENDMHILKSGDVTIKVNPIKRQIQVKGDTIAYDEKISYVLPQAQMDLDELRALRAKAKAEIAAKDKEVVQPPTEEVPAQGANNNLNHAVM
jgi:hypothetical protein